jgi:hypothetical protein
MRPADAGASRWQKRHRSAAVEVEAAARNALKAAKPADLPVEQPTKFKLVS